MKSAMEPSFEVPALNEHARSDQEATPDTCHGCCGCSIWTELRDHANAPTLIGENKLEDRVSRKETLDSPALAFRLHSVSIGDS